ncbi:hypothetical protein LK994_09810 [Ferruginibacter lapsinanis]|uniref:hypothetical protein n=1 Tax=Ferruginibacter lapsinanis TaxID=563172 RepID=UPI001E31EFA5|nr:hypothetical protein [Ferruginibacter lapsinanis]UEG48931.1 hypothetical protein LK994_09810 [Ferruginibacter lapsinanis]
MSRFLPFLLMLFIATSSFGQNINGQWRGFFDDNGNISLYNEQSTEYVLELNISGEHISGYSYTYFQGRKYFVICSLSGSYDPSTKSIKVTETARIKGNTPPMQDCLQTHILSYKKVNGKEELVGSWKPAPGYDCGVGSTTLSRKKVATIVAANTKKPQSSSLFSQPKPVDQNKKNNPSAKPEIPPVAKNNVKPKITPPVTAPSIEKSNTEIKESPKSNGSASKAKEVPEIALTEDFEKRDNNILKTIEIDNETFKIELYDNGEVDGDSVSLFYNGKLILLHKKLSTKPISLNLSIDDDTKINELIMYADNLGEIPPNTALMIVTDGDNRYEVRITSDLQKSGTIRFIRKPK